MESNQNLLNSDLQIDQSSHIYLSETARWANFLSIVGFVLSVILAIAGLFTGVFLGSMSSSYGNSSVIGAGFAAVFYLIIAVLYFVMSLFLYRFASKMKMALYTNDQETLNHSFLNLKNLYKMMGILTIIYLCLIVLFMIFGIGAASFLR